MLSRQVAIFIEVAECGSFSKAAEKVYVTSASIMKHMNSLENSLNITLLERSSTGIKLTPAGKVFFTEAKKFNKM